MGTVGEALLTSGASLLRHKGKIMVSRSVGLLAAQVLALLACVPDCIGVWIAGLCSWLY